MKTLITSVCTTALICAGTFAVAQDKSTAAKQSKEVQQETKTSTAKGTAKVTTDTVNGKVQNFEAGKSIKVTVPGKIVSKILEPGRQGLDVSRAEQPQTWRLGDGQ